MENDFELVGQITGIEVIAVNLSIRELQRLKELFGGCRWRKLKGVALVRFLLTAAQPMHLLAWKRI
jgi:hypothetical protein